MIPSGRCQAGTDLRKLRLLQASLELLPLRVAAFRGATVSRLLQQGQGIHMKRRPSTQDLTWLIDLARTNRLDLDPPYQRRSVWTRKDKQYFLDTILRNYPSPAIFLHKTIGDGGAATYHVVDGKQRVQTVLDFVNNKIKAAPDFGDARIDDKSWSEIQGNADLMQSFWNYQITVEMIDFVEGAVVNEVFERLNRNSRKLHRQELRHAKFDGWLITLAEAEAQKKEWQDLSVATRARSKRMVDVQFISELLLVLLDGKIVGFDQDYLDESYAQYDELEVIENFEEDDFIERLEDLKQYVLRLQSEREIVSRFAKGFAHFYSLWALLGLAPELPEFEGFANKYIEFMGKVQELAGQDDLAAFMQVQGNNNDYARAFTYLTNSRGASTEPAQRQERMRILQEAVLAANA